MPLVRLQCPACASIVKISDEIAAQHPLVRCAKCQGLVTVASSRVIEPAASVDDGDDYNYKPKKKKRKSSGSTVPVGMIVGIVVALLVLVGAGIGVFFLIDHFGGSPLERQFKRALANMQKMADAVESIKTPQDVSKAFDQMKDAVADLKQLDEDNRKNGINPNSEEAKKIGEKYMPQILKLTAQMQGSMMKLALNPEIAQALRENAAKLGAGMNQLALIGGGFNLPNRHAQPDFGNNSPPSQPGTPPSKNVAQQQLENALMAKRMQALVLPPLFDGIRDSDTADLAFLSMESVLQSLNQHERMIKQYQQQGAKLTTTTAQNTLREMEKTTNELAVHLSRIEKLPGLGGVHAKLVSKLSDVGLAPTTGTAASSRTPPGNDTGNPFESASSGNPGSTPKKSEEGNPFESAGAGGSRGSPGKSDGGNPFEPAGSSGKSGSMDSLLAKLTSNEHFKKLEGLKDAQSAKVEESSRAAVLEALLKLCDDSDVHQKVEVLKAYKKWASTQEEKEKLGEHAEALLKDHWAKKDALRYFGENKVITASKEVAYLLKDNFERKDAAETLIAMGSEAEKSVIPHLTDLEPQVRQMAIEVLARIGTPACIPDLQKLKSDRFVGRAASQAITLINSRKK